MDTTKEAHAVALARSGHYEEALALFLEAVQQNPHSIALHNYLGNTYKHLEHFDSALKHYQEAFRLAPFHPGTLMNLGGLYYQYGLYHKAKPILERLVKHEPFLFAGRLALAHTLVHLEEFQAAMGHYQKILEKEPLNLSALHNYGMLLVRQGQYEQGAHVFETRLNQEEDSEAFFHFGVCLVHIGKTADAIAAYLRVLELTPTHTQAAHNLAALYLNQGDHLHAAQYFKIAMLDPNNATARHLYYALSQEVVPVQADTGFVEVLFDQYADHYNTHMQETLQYQVPGLLRKAIAPFLTGSEIIADIGCGTGLLAPYVNDIATKLYGFDISQSMLQVAKKLGVYYRLIAGDFLETSEAFANQFGIAIAADVLVYFGALEAMFEKIAKVLSPGGLFAFSCERTDMGESYILLSSGRYAHTESYLRSVCDRTGWSVLSLEKHPIRKDHANWVFGWIVVLKKND